MAVLAISAAGALGAGSLASAGVIGASFLGVSAAQWGWMVGSIAGNLLFGPEGQHTEGPRLGDTVYTGEVEGTDMPILYGGDRVPGKPIWLKNPPRHVQTTQEVGGKGGGGGSTHTTHTYYQDFMLNFGDFICENPPRRIWANQELVYDASGDNEEVTNSSFSFTWYSGKDNSVDSILENDVGIGNSPSYLGRCCMMVENLNLTNKYGNRLPVIEVELQTTGTSSTALTEYDMGTTGAGPNYNGCNFAIMHPNNQEMLMIPLMTVHGYASEVFYVNMSSQYVERNFSYTNTIAELAWFSEVDFLYPFNDNPGYYIVTEYNSANAGHIYKVEFPTGRLVTSVAVPHSSGGVEFLAEGFNIFLMRRNGLAGATGLLKQFTKQNFNWGSDITLPGNLDSSNTCNFVCKNYYNSDFLFLGQNSADNNEWAVYEITSPGLSPIITKLAEPFVTNYSDWTPGGHPDDGFYDPVNDEYWVPMYNIPRSTDPGLAVISGDTGVVKYFFDFLEDFSIASSAYWGIGSGLPHLCYEPQRRRLWFGLSGTGDVGSVQIDSKTFSWYTGGTGGEAWAWSYPNRNTIWSAKEDGNAFVVTEKKLNLIASGEITIASIIADIFERCGVESTEYDVSSITGSIGSFIHASRHSGRSDIELLLGLAQADCIQSDYKLKTINKGATPALTIPEDDLGAEEITGEPTAIEPLLLKEPMALEIPRVFEVTYRSKDNVYLKGLARSYTAIGSSNNDKTLQLPCALTDAFAIEIAEKMHQQILDPKVFTFNLPVKYTYLEPTDVIEVPKNDKNYSVRLVKIDRGTNWVNKCEAILAYNEDYNTTAISAGVDSFLGQINSDLSPLPLILDGPLLRDEDSDHPGPYLGNFVYSSIASNCYWHYSPDNSTWQQFLTQFNQPVVGKVITAANGTIWEDWDDISFIDVTILNNGSLSSTTKANIEADPTINAFAYGREGRWEYLNAATVTLQSSDPKVYRLTNLLRGRRGTDNYIATHQSKDYLITLNTSVLNRHILQNSQIGNIIYYRIPTEGQAVSDVSSTSLEINGQPLKPYSPIQISGIDNAGDIDITWTRRTRKGGSLGGDNSLTDGVGGPINEETEEYEIDIINSSNNNVINTYSSTTTALSYTTAQQATDNTDILGQFYTDIYQLSTVVGRGYRGRALYDRGWGNVVNTILDYAPDAFILLDDADSANVTSFPSRTNIGTYTSGSTESSLVSNNYASMACDGASYADIGRTLKDALAGATKATILFFFKHFDNGSSNYYLEVSQGDSAEMFSAYASASNYIGVRWSPKTTVAGPLLQVGTLSDYALTHVNMIGSSVNLESTFQLIGCLNGIEENVDTYGTGHSGYAGALLTQTNNPSYTDTIGARTDKTSPKTNGSLGFIVAFKNRVVTAAEQRIIYRSIHENVTDQINALQPITWTILEELDNSSPSSWADELSLNPWTNSGLQGRTNGPSYVFGNERMATSIDLYNDYASMLLPSAWKIQTFTIFIAFSISEALTTGHTLLSLLPIAGIADGRGIRLQVHNTDGLKVGIGTGAGFTYYDAGTANVSTLNTGYTACLVCDEADELRLYLNGTEIANSAGSPVTIEWSDGTPGVPTTAKAYINQGEPLQTGIKGGFGNFCFFNKVLTDTEITNLSNAVLGTVV